MRELVHGHDAEAAGEEHEPAEPQLRRDHERRAVAVRDQVREHTDPDHRQQRERDQRRTGQQPPPARPVHAIDDLTGAGHQALAWPERPSVPRLRRLAGHGRGDAFDQAALAEIGQQPGEALRAGGAEALLGAVDELGRRVRAVELLEQPCVVVAEPQERAGLEILEHPPAVAFGGLQPLERVAGTHAHAYEPDGDAMPAGTTIVCSDSIALRGCATTSSVSPSRRRAPSCNGAGPVMRTPSRNVPDSDPRSCTDDPEIRA